VRLYSQCISAIQWHFACGERSGAVREQNKGATDIITWHHFVPDLKNPTLMRETTCHKLYGQLLRTVDRKEDCCGWSSFGQLKDALKNRDPVFLKKWEKHK
jgi:hypothetical protein